MPTSLRDEALYEAMLQLGISGGRDEIRTREGFRREIKSLLPLTTWLRVHFISNSMD